MSTLQTLLNQCLPNQDPIAQAREHAQRWTAWLQPISVDAPVGQDPGYEDDFQRMRDELDKLSGADAELVIRLAETLLMHRCKDLRVATYYLWARLHRDGEAGLADGLGLLAALLERYAERLLPARANSRRQALEWLASGRVLASLALHPQVLRAEAERSAAALAWLEQLLQAWPQAQRPALGGLYSALVARLAQAGGVDAIVPQTASEAPASQPAPEPAPIRSGRDLLDSGRVLAGYLRERPEGWLAGHRLMKALRWDTLQQLPIADGHGITRLAAPRGEYRTLLKRLHRQQAWGELLDQAERMYAEGVNHFWLDLQWYLHQALGKSAPPHDSWAETLSGDLRLLLQRLPGLEALRWSDGSAFADETTRGWIDQQVLEARAEHWLPASSALVDELQALESEAQALADSEGLEPALAWLGSREGLHGGRQHWQMRLLMARLAEQYGKAELALHLLAELDASAQRHGLGQWEPQLDFEVKARRLKLLRAKALRSDIDRPAIARQMDAQLAALVAIDPVRAAVLCG